MEPPSPSSPALTAHDTTALAERWPLPGDDRLRDELLEAWGEDSRDYHDTRHLTEVLDRLDELAANGTDFDRLTVGLAAWFHDAVYDGERDAEERSAAWAEDVLGSAVDARRVAEVARLVRLTETHQPTDDDPDGCALSDADLAILAAPTARYEEYAAAVRREYSHIDDGDFRLGRAHLLRDLAAKSSLFHSAYARARWEGPARANLAGELETLQAIQA